MRSAIVTAFILVPLCGWAQKPAEPPPPPQQVEAAPEEEAEAQGGETEALEVVQEGDAVRMTPEGRPSAPGEVHTVVRGDTLWDLSQRFLGSPWYWPKVWSYNPEIANPHWIYPGNLVRFFQGGEEGPTQVEAGQPEDLGPVAGELAPAEMLDDVQLVGKIGYTPKGAVLFRQVGFVTPKELEEAGKIDSSFAETEMLSFPDTAYVAFKRKSDAKVGDRYVVFETVSEVKHPVTGERFGYMTRLLGTMKVTSVADKLVSATVQDTWDEINRGHLVGPYGEVLTKAVAPRPNERELKGHVIATLEPQVSFVGEHHVVIVDKGSNDGVQPGNTFTVIRQNDPTGAVFLSPEKSNGRFPVEDIGTCMAVEVKAKATTCLLTRSLREVVRGDRVVMKPSGGAASPPRASLR